MYAMLLCMCCVDNRRDRMQQCRCVSQATTYLFATRAPAPPSKTPHCGRHPCLWDNRLCPLHELPPEHIQAEISELAVPHLCSLGCISLLLPILQSIDSLSCMQRLCCKLSIVLLDKSMRTELGFGKSTHAYWILIGEEVA